MRFLILLVFSILALIGFTRIARISRNRRSHHMNNHPHSKYFLIKKINSIDKEMVLIKVSLKETAIKQIMKSLKKMKQNDNKEKVESHHLLLQEEEEEVKKEEKEEEEDTEIGMIN